MEMSPAAGVSVGPPAIGLVSTVAGEVPLTGRGAQKGVNRARYFPPRALAFPDLPRTHFPLTQFTTFPKRKTW